MLVEDAHKSQVELGINEPHFKAFREFQKSSYVKRYTILGQKLVRDRLYSGACVIISPRMQGAQAGAYAPSAELGFQPSLRHWSVM